MISLVNTANAADVTAAFAGVMEPIVTNVIDPLIWFAFSLATIVFIYGVAQMIINPVDAEAHKKGKMSMLGGLIGLFIMLSAWGIVHLVANTVGQFNR
jgi:hypothetical protein